LDDIRIWMPAHPTHGPVIVKIEMKNGFDDTLGMDPTEFDSYVKAHLGSTLYTPAEVDVEYAQHLLDLYNSGDIADAAVFPSVLGAQTGDPRDRYCDTDPALAGAEARVAELAADGASFISTDWNTAPANAVLGEVLLRG
jgi:hypothetical protein